MSVWLGVDPALGGGNAIIACQLTVEKLYVLDCRIDYQYEEHEQIIEAITQMARTYRPSVCWMEFDSQQKGLGNDHRLRAVAALLGFEIRPHYTRGNKADPVFGVASMNQSFIKQEISIPYADPDTQRRMDALVSQLRTWRPDVPTKKLRQDAVMALWFCWRNWMQTRVARHEPPPPLPRPQWMQTQSARRPVDLMVAQ